MDGQRSQQLFAEYAHAMAYIDVMQPNGDRSIGSAFHVGEGVFVTARHVVENNSVVEVRITESLGVLAREHLRSRLGRDPTEGEVEKENNIYSRDGNVPRYRYYHEPLHIVEGPYLASSEDLDVAVSKVDNIHPSAGVIRLGFHLDDWMYRVPWQLSEAIILGYPPIPMVNAPVLVPAKAEVHTFVQPRHTRYLHFILSSTPRGGYSGGVAIHETGDALGVITSSFVEGDKPPELGFFAVLSIEGIIDCLVENNLYVGVQRNYHKSFLGIDPGPVFAGMPRFKGSKNQE